TGISEEESTFVTVFRQPLIRGTTHRCSGLDPALSAGAVCVRVFVCTGARGREAQHRAPFPSSTVRGRSSDGGSALRTEDGAGAVADADTEAGDLNRSGGLLDRKVLLVAGAGPGMGEATARVAVREGARVCVLARTRSRVEGLAESIRNAGGSAIALECD